MIPRPHLSVSFPRLWLPDECRPLPVMHWRINGWPAELVIHPPSDDPPEPDAQRHPTSGLWVTLRMADGGDRHVQCT